MVIAIGADHGGFLYKDYIKKTVKNVQFIDVGADKLDEADDYTDFSFKVAELVASKKADYAVIICRTGVGSVIAMNKVHGIRAGLCETVEDCHIARAKNNINAVSFGADNICKKRAVRIVNELISTSFDGGRHKRRVDKIMEYERTH